MIHWSELASIGVSRSSSSGLSIAIRRDAQRHSGTANLGDDGLKGPVGISDSGWDLADRRECNKAREVGSNPYRNLVMQPSDELRRLTETHPILRVL